MGRAVARQLNADRSDEAGPRLPCRCGCGCAGGEARFAGRRPKTFTTALGPMTLERAWHHCDGCGHGFSPRDRDLGMADSSLSPAVLRMVGAAAARTSFGGSSGLLRELAGLRVAAKAIHGPGTDLAESWGRQRREELDQGRLDDVIAALRSHADSCEEARKDAECFSANRERMDYPKFRSKGLCVATGVVEGGCKSIVGNRLKQGGMRWTVEGANAIIALRCAVESNRFDDFWERRAAKTA